MEYENHGTEVQLAVCFYFSIFLPHLDNNFKSCLLAALSALQCSIHNDMYNRNYSKSVLY